MKTLLLARHAKSDWNHPGLDDFKRPLNERGERDAPRMALFLKQCGYLIHQIVSSDAVRALSTAEYYKEQLDPAHELITHHDLYNASYRDIVDIAMSLNDDFNTVMIVGHNPGMEQALEYLARSGIDDMPTCSVAIIQFDVNSWSQLSPANGELLAFEYPKKIK